MRDETPARPVDRAQFEPIELESDHGRPAPVSVMQGAGYALRARGALGALVAAGTLILVAVFGLAADAYASALAQGPQKARKTPRPETATLVGVIEGRGGESGLPDDAIVLVSVRKGDGLQHIAICVAGTAEAPPTTATHYGEPLDGSALRVALQEPGRSVRVTYVVEPLPGTASHIARTIEIGDAPQKGSPAPGLKYEDIIVGLGTAAQRGDGVRVHYIGWLKGGEQFESSYERGQALEFRLGSGKVIRGWELGIQGMREGGRRRLTIGPSLAYGAAGSGNRIPPNATLTFEVELLKVE